MAEARIVYEGAVGGDLFAGKVFFLSQRIPFRNTYKGYIESNGGKITSIEKHADMLIADHARKDPPVGSISWKWIEESVKNGRLEDIENYRAGPAEPQIREVGSGQPTRKGRVKFTAEDDRILAEWCTRAERKGLLLRGNEVYKQLALKHPRHTFQSWRDHWIKQLAHLRRPEISDYEDDDDEAEETADVGEEEEEEPVNEPTLASQQPMQPGQRRSDPRPTSKTAPPSMRRTQSALLSKAPTRPVVASPVRSERSQASTLARYFETNPHLLKSAGGNFFTNEETQLLLDEYDAIMNLSDDQSINAWIAWSMAHPNHNPQEWRNYFKEYVLPTHEARIEAEKKQQSKEASSVENDHIEETTEQNGSKEPRKATKVKDSQGSSGQTGLSPPKTTKLVDPWLNDPEEFENNILILADSLDLEVNLNPVICGCTVSLFDLWKIVQSEQFGGYDAVTGQEAWQNVAVKLNFDPHQSPSAASDLRACYSEILADFEGIRCDYLEQEVISESQQEEMINDQLLQTVLQTATVTGKEVDVEDDQQQDNKEHANGSDQQEDEFLMEYEEHDDDLDSAQISPHLPRLPSTLTGKRRVGVDRRKQDIPYNKRQRIDKGKDREIPSTPEDIINNNLTLRRPHQPSPLKFAEAPPGSSDTSDSSIGEIQPIKFNRPKAVAKKIARTLEPETQDFHYSQLPQYPPLPTESLDDNDRDSLFIPQRRPSVNVLDGDDEDKDLVLIRQSSPLLLSGFPERRNISTTTTRGSLHSSSNYESSTQSQTELEIQAEITTFVNKHVSDGIPQETLLDAIEATTYDCKVARKIIDSMAGGDGIPENIPGVWTKLDDDALKLGKGTEEYRRVVRKHGISRISKRRGFFSDIKNAAEDRGDV